MNILRLEIHLGGRRMPESFKILSVASEMFDNLNDFIVK